MLDRLKCLEELEQQVPRFCAEANKELKEAERIFWWLRDNEDTVAKIKALDTPCTVPSWKGDLQTTFLLKRFTEPYRVIAADGSQVYPDRHRGIPCYLLNSGIVNFTYGETSSAQLFSVPRVYTQLDEENSSEDMVNCHRMELELEAGLQYSRSARNMNPDLPTLFLIDGSLIVWYLEAKSPVLKERFFKRYMELFDQFYRAGIPYLSYISLPKSRDLVALFKNGAEAHLLPLHNTSWNTLIDTDIMRFFLPVDHYSTLFTPHSRLLELYPDHLRPSFLYLHNQDEIARLELPAWVLQDTYLQDQVLAIVADQCMKGNGYPIALSEAHEQAVVRADEKEFFFTMLSHLGVQHAWYQHSSQKSMKKRWPSV